MAQSASSRRSHESIEDTSPALPNVLRHARIRAGDAVEGIIERNLRAFGITLKNSGYSQLEGREELFERK
jgi:hypothetical protein